MKHAFVFPGQGAQYPGMGKSFYDNSSFSKKIIEQANEILGFRTILYNVIAPLSEGLAVVGSIYLLPGFRLNKAYPSKNPHPS